MLWNIQRDILVIISIIQIFSCSVPCLCFRSIPFWRCIPTCFQDDSYRKYYSLLSDSRRLNDVNFPRQQQQYEQRELWQPDQYNYEPAIYISETTPYPCDEQLDASKLRLRQSQPVSMLHQYDTDYLLETVNDLSNRTASTYLPSFPVIHETLENPTSKLQSAKYNVLKQQNIYSTKNMLRRHYPPRAAFPSAVCNSRKLRKVMLRAITTDVLESKRSVMEAAEYAYHGIKFDVICAQGIYF
ncbi:UvrABC system protein [Dirofilaria immitis]